MSIDKIRIPQRPWDESLLNTRLMRGPLLENWKIATELPKDLKNY